MTQPTREELNALVATDVRIAVAPESVASILANPPFIPTRSLINIRDAGAVQGSALRKGHIFRSGLLQGAAQDPEALAWLGSHVTRIFDLRRAEEVAKAPDPDVAGVENVWFAPEGQYPTPKLEGFADGDGSAGWKEQLLSIAITHSPIIRAVLEHVHDRPTEGFLFHCTAGRDRTGVVAGLLQALAGTAPEDIIFDYMLSRLGTEPARDKLVHFALASVGTTDMETPGFANLVSLRPSYWLAFMEGLEETFGGWDGYVTQRLGFSEKELAKIKTTLRS